MSADTVYQPISLSYQYESIDIRCKYTDRHIVYKFIFYSPLIYVLFFLFRF